MYLKRKASCPPCEATGSCVRCGCPFHKMALSSKPCKPVWDKTTFTINDAKPKETYSFAFKYTGKLAIKGVSTGCACTNVRYAYDTDGVIVSGMYKTAEFPPVLKDLGHTSTIMVQTINVHMDAGEDMYLTVQARVHV